MLGTVFGREESVAVSKRLKQLRKNANLTIPVLANEIGISENTIGRLEYLGRHSDDEVSGRLEAIISGARVDTIVKYAKYFRVTTDYILGIEEPDVKESRIEIAQKVTGLTREALDALEKADMSFAERLSCLLEDREKARQKWKKDSREEREKECGESKGGEIE